MSTRPELPTLGRYTIGTGTLNTFLVGKDQFYNYHYIKEGRYCWFAWSIEQLELEVAKGKDSQRYGLFGGTMDAYPPSEIAIKRIYNRVGDISDYDYIYPELRPFRPYTPEEFFKEFTKHGAIQAVLKNSDPDEELDIIHLDNFITNPFNGIRYPVDRHTKKIFTYQELFENYVEPITRFLIGIEEEI